MNIKVKFIYSAFLIIILFSILINLFGCSTVKKIHPQGSLPQNSNFPKNESGETFGSALGISPNEKEPDLIKAKGIDGTIGYVRLTELNGKEPKSPEEALAQQAKETGREINLYKSDGKTVIGKFVIGKASGNN